MIKKIVAYFKWDYSRVKMAFYENKISIPDWLFTIYYLVVLPFGMLAIIPFGIFYGFVLLKLRWDISRILRYEKVR